MLQTVESRPVDRGGQLLSSSGHIPLPQQHLAGSDRRDDPPLGGRCESGGRRLVELPYRFRDPAGAHEAAKTDLVEGELGEQGAGHRLVQEPAAVLDRLVEDCGVPGGSGSAGEQDDRLGAFGVGAGGVASLPEPVQRTKVKAGLAQLVAMVTQRMGMQARVSQAPGDAEAWRPPHGGGGRPAPRGRAVAGRGRGVAARVVPD
ncbi:hypothetical protein ABZW30_34390 [Kitasatospora sp. NPDC004669]|uniref:hypothetical protein n=1 Tax=Kitasatospora sp. NPDC004669 TaxID=3154555 RepID=UPI0033B280AC